MEFLKLKLHNFRCPVKVDRRSLKRSKRLQICTSIMNRHRPDLAILLHSLLRIARFKRTNDPPRFTPLRLPSCGFAVDFCAHTRSPT
jgi:hypothetical protein